MDIDAQAKESAQIIKDGGIIAYPTDTLYALGVDATNPDAVRRLFALKQSPPDKNFLIMVKDVAMLKQYADVSLYGEKLLETIWPGPLSLVAPRLNVEILKEVNKGVEIGSRMTNHPFREVFFKYIDVPITATSANISGCSPLTSPEEIKKQFPNIDYVVDGGICTGNPSTVVSIEGEILSVIRAGAISVEALEKTWQGIVGKKGRVTHANSTTIQ